MKKIPSYLLLFVCSLTLGCASQKSLKDNPWKGSGADTTPTLLGVFKGVLPCADCPGLETELSLTQYGPNIAEGTYSLKETYQSRNTQPLQSQGTWTTLRGTPKDDNATVYQLNPDHPEKSRYFLKLDDSTLEMLDEQLEIPTQNFLLKKE